MSNTKSPFGFTRRAATDLPEYDAVDEIVRQYTEAIEANADDIDYQGWSEQAEISVTDMVVEGAQSFIAQEYTEHAGSWQVRVPNTEPERWFEAGMADDDFNGYTQFTAFLEACEKIPALAETFGVYGQGIVL